MTALAVPQPQAIGVVDLPSLCEQANAWVAHAEDVAEIRDNLNKFAAIDRYMELTGADQRKPVQATMRRFEARIGDLLGEAEMGSNQHSGGFDHDQTLSPKQRHEFRQMAAHRDVVEDVIDQSTDAAPASRRKVVDAIRQRTQRRPVDEWTDEERDLRRQLDDGDTIVVSLRAHPHLIQWATTEGRFERVDRRTKWGNPFEMPADGDRETVIRNYAEHYLPNKPSLLDHLGDLQGKALGCWCAPEPCHADVLKREVDG